MWRSSRRTTRCCSFVQATSRSGASTSDGLSSTSSPDSSSSGISGGAAYASSTTRRLCSTPTTSCARRPSWRQPVWNSREASTCASAAGPACHRRSSSSRDSEAGASTSSGATTTPTSVASSPRSRAGRGSGGMGRSSRSCYRRAATTYASSWQPARSSAPTSASRHRESGGPTSAWAGPSVPLPRTASPSRLRPRRSLRSAVSSSASTSCPSRPAMSRSRSTLQSTSTRTIRSEATCTRTLQGRSVSSSSRPAPARRQRASIPSERRRHVSLARLFGNARADRGSALQAAALAHRPEPALSPGRGDDERRRLRGGLVRLRRATRSLPQHRAGMSRPQPARARGAHRVAARVRAHPSILGVSRAADELPSLPLRELALHAQRRDQQLRRHETRSRARSRPVALSEDRRLDRLGGLFLPGAHARSRRRPAVRGGGGRGSDRGSGLSAQRRSSGPDDRRGQRRRAHLGVPLFEPAEVAVALLLDEGGAAAFAGFGFQAAALHGGRLSVVQPVLVTELIFVLVLRWLWLRQRVRPAAWGSAALTCISLAVFLVAAEPRGGNSSPTPSAWLWAIGPFGGAAVALTVFATRGSPARRAAQYGAAAAVAGGLEATFIKTSADTLTTDGVSAVLGEWPVYALALSGALLVQAALHVGPLS